MKFYPVYTLDMANYLTVECKNKMYKILDYKDDPTGKKKIILFADIPKVHEDANNYFLLKEQERIRSLRKKFGKKG